MLTSTPASGPARGLPTAQRAPGQGSFRWNSLDHGPAAIDGREQDDSVRPDPWPSPPPVPAARPPPLGAPVFTAAQTPRRWWWRRLGTLRGIAQFIDAPGGHLQGAFLSCSTKFPSLFRRRPSPGPAWALTPAGVRSTNGNGLAAIPTRCLPTAEPASFPLQRFPPVVLRENPGLSNGSSFDGDGLRAPYSRPDGTAGPSLEA